MFGSLVLVLPISHEGGELVLRADGHPDARYDSSAILASHEKPTIIYVAFYGDIEHEVLPVTSGNRVTLTYNLLFEDGAVEGEGLTPGIPNAPLLRHPFAMTLLDALKRPEFLPDGGLLGYPLKFEYPVGNRGNLDAVKNNLKGEDANVEQTCRILKLDASIVILSKVDDSDSPPHSHYVTVSGVPDTRKCQFEDVELYEELLRRKDAFELTWAKLRNPIPRCKKIKRTDPVYGGGLDHQAQVSPQWTSAPIYRLRKRCKSQLPVWIILHPY